MVPREVRDFDEGEPAANGSVVSYQNLKKNKVLDSLLTLEDLVGPENEVWLLKAPSDVRKHSSQL